MFENEEWRVIEEIPKYMVSDCGRIKSLVTDEGKLRKTYVNDKGNTVVLLYGMDSKSRYLRHVSKLVALAFLDPPFYSDETSIWHKDGQLHNCHVDNLKWDTRSRVMEWNEMNRSGRPSRVTPKVRNNRTGIVYENAYECGMAEGRLENDIIIRVEKQGRSSTDPAARYMYIIEDKRRVLQD